LRNTADVTGGKPIAVFLQSISGVSAINPLVAFYDIHGGEREVLFFYFVPDTAGDKINIHTYLQTYHSRFIPEGIAKVSQIFLRDTHVLPKIVSYEEHCRRDRW
jgi:hypothetical protein